MTIRGPEDGATHVRTVHRLAEVRTDVRFRTLVACRAAAERHPAVACVSAEEAAEALCVSRTKIYELMCRAGSAR